MKFLSRLLSLLFAVFLVAACVSGQPPALSAAASPAMIAELEDETVALYTLTSVHPVCTGVWIGDRSILTAAHCASEDVLEPLFFSLYSEHVGLFMEPLRKHSMELVRIDTVHDLALYHSGIFDTPKHHSATVSSRIPSVGETLHFEGHTRGLAWSYKRGWVSAYRGATDLSGDSEVRGPWMQISGPISNGDSGGGAYNEQGYLVGICSRMPNAPNMVFYVYLPTIRKFLETK